MDTSIQVDLRIREFRLLLLIVEQYRDYRWFYPGGWPDDEKADAVDSVMRKLQSYYLSFEQGDKTEATSISLSLSFPEWKLVLDSGDFIRGAYQLQPESTADDFDWNAVDDLIVNIQNKGD